MYNFACDLKHIENYVRSLVPLQTIPRIPNRFCGMRDRDYFGNGKRDVCKNSERDSGLLKVAGSGIYND